MRASFPPEPEPVETMADRIYLRFDIDTVACIGRGVPRLRELARKHGCRFTFFVNMGRSVDLRESLLGSPGRTLENVSGTTAKVSAWRKLGVWDFARTLLLNPRVGSRHRDELHRLQDEGHELALHGGDNHGTWQRLGHAASRATFERWLLPTHERFAEEFGAPAGFGSPGANANPALYPLLRELGYRYASDRMAPDPVSLDASGLAHIPVHGQVDEVPLIEHLCAKGLPREAVVAETVRACESFALKTLVGHPVWEGYRAIDTLDAVLTELRNRGYGFGLYSDLVPGDRRDG